MIRTLIAITFFLCISFTGFTQSAITFGFDNLMLLGIGAQLKYTHSFKAVQLGAYGSASSQYFIERNSNPIYRYGLSLNSVPKTQQKVSLYAGGSIEHFRTKRDVRNYWHPTFVEKGWSAGPQLGMNINFANKHLRLNIEWCARAGFYDHYSDESSPGGARYHLIDKRFIAYSSGMIGLTYVFKN